MGEWLYKPTFSWPRHWITTPFPARVLVLVHGYLNNCYCKTSHFLPMRKHGPRISYRFSWLILVLQCLKSAVSNRSIWLAAAPLRVEADPVSETLCFVQNTRSWTTPRDPVAVSVISRPFRIKLSSDEVIARCQLVFITDISLTDKQILILDVRFIQFLMQPYNY
jgi:hypothetical protein